MLCSHRSITIILLWHGDAEELRRSCLNHTAGFVFINFMLHQFFETYKILTWWSERAEEHTQSQRGSYACWHNGGGRHGIKWRPVRRREWDGPEVACMWRRRRGCLFLWGPVSLRWPSGGSKRPQKVEVGRGVLVFLWVHGIDKARGAIYYTVSTERWEELHQRGGQ